MKNKKKKLTSAIAVATALALLVGGTFAWQSISQTALNEKEAIVNPGGRLHDDFDGENKDVYVENFADDDIFARVRLDEYFEIVMNKSTPAETTEVITTGATKADTSTYLTHKFGDENSTDDYWDWITGGSTVYMPTFNKNKDSLTADINGTMSYEDADGNADPYGDYVDYSEFTGNDADGASATGVGAGKTANAIYDADSNTVDEFADDTAEKDVNYKEVEETHYVAETGEGSLISMEEWLELSDDGEDTANYWVYDTDGWCYWSSPIKADTATGLLLDGISLTEVMDDSYYYAINVVGQFVTADDLGKDDNTGFYADATQAPSDDALTLLETIGVNISGAEVDDDVEAQNAKIQIALYDGDGTKVAGHGAGSTLAANSTYDIVGTIKTPSGDYVVYDSRDNGQLSDEVEADVTVYANAYDSDYSTYNCINSDGRLVTGAESTFDYSNVEGDIYKSLSVQVSLTDVTVSDSETYELVETEYNLYPNGKEVFQWQNGQDTLFADRQRRSSDSFNVLDGNGNDITNSGELELSITGNTDSDTKLELKDSGIVFTVGAAETSTRFVLIAKNEYGKAERTFGVVYKGSLILGDIEVYPFNGNNGNTPIVVSSTDPTEITLQYKDYWGNLDSNVTYEIDDYFDFGASVTGDKLYLPADYWIDIIITVHDSTVHTAIYYMKADVR